MAFRITPSLGPGLETVIKDGEVWFDIPGKGTLISPRLGSKVIGSDGRDYLLVQAGGSINASTQIAVSADFEATTGGSSGYYTQGTAVVDGDFFWARKSAL